MSPSRERLRSAIDAEKKAAAAARKADEVLERGRTLVAEAAKSITAFDGLQLQISAHHTGNLRAGVMRPLPDELRAGQRARSEAVENHELVTAALETLQADRDAAYCGHDDAVEAVKVLWSQIRDETVNAMLDEIDILQQKADGLRRRALGYSLIQTGADSSISSQLSMRVILDVQNHGQVRSGDDDMKAWRAFRKAIETDADAQLARPS